MALKRQNNLMEAFSMASMTDVVFLLLIFFMVTSTYIFPTAIEVNLPQSTEQTSLKPSVRIYLDAEGQLMAVQGDGELQPMEPAQLSTWLRLVKEQSEEEPFVALYADEALPYGRVVEVLNVGAGAGIKMVLATRPSKDPAEADLLQGTAPDAAAVEAADIDMTTTVIPEADVASL